MDEDDVNVEIINGNGDKELRPYKANKYIKEYYKTQEKFIDEMFSNKIITYKSIGEILKLTETVTRNAITKSVKDLDVRIRRSIHIFFNKDYYPELGLYNNRCIDCTNKCKQNYWVNVVACNKYKKSKAKTNNK